MREGGREGGRGIADDFSHFINDIFRIYIYFCVARLPLYVLAWGYEVWEEEVEGGEEEEEEDEDEEEKKEDEDENPTPVSTEIESQKN